jgi:hypothetical protein
LELATSRGLGEAASNVIPPTQRALE